MKRKPTNARKPHRPRRPIRKSNPNIVRAALKREAEKRRLRKHQEQLRLQRNARRRAAYKFGKTNPQAKSVLRSIRDQVRSKPQTSPRVRVDTDSEYWLIRAASGSEPQLTRAFFTRKSIQSPRTDVPFHIKKKCKAISAKGTIREQMREVGGGIAKFLRLPKKGKRLKKPKKAYFKTMIRDSKGNTRWVSSKREEIASRSELIGRLNAQAIHIKGYGSDFAIIGYECEETI